MLEKVGERAKGLSSSFDGSEGVEVGGSQSPLYSD